MINSFRFTFSYLIFVLIFDLLTWNFNQFSFLDWKLSNGFDAFKFIFWFVIPFLFLLKRNQLKINLPETIEKSDVLLLIGVLLLGGLTFLLIPQIDVLRDYYVVSFKMNEQEKIAFILKNTYWIISWAIGWEILFRSFLLRSIDTKKIKMAFWLLPLVEGLYHFQKPWPEIVGVVIFSALLTYWTVKRGHVFFALIFHLIIEFLLVFFLISIN